MSAPPLIDRPQLVERIGRTRVTVVAAPPGLGKTAVVRSWAQHQGDAVAWADCSTLLVGDGPEFRSLLADVLVGQGDGDADAAAGPAGRGRRGGLVIDDADRALSGSGRELLEGFVRSWPGPEPLVVIGRDLDWLRSVDLGEGIATIDHHDLLLRPEEVDAVVDASRGALTADAARRAAGWVGGLRFCGPPVTVQPLGMYLEEEVLQWLDPLEREVLDAIAVLAPTSVGELAAVLDLPPSQVDGVVHRLGRGWVPGLRRDVTGPRAGRDQEGHGSVRLPALVGDHLSSLVASGSADRLVRLHRRAATAAEAAGDLGRAHHQILRSGFHDAEADIVRRRAVELVANGEAGRAVEWIDRLPHREVTTDRGLALARAGASMAAGDVGDAAVWLAIAERLSGEDAQGPSLLRPRRVPSVEAAGPDPVGGSVDGVSAIDHLFAAWTAYVSNDLEGAEVLLQEIARDAAALPILDGARWLLLAQISLERAEWRRAREQADAAIDRIAGGGEDIDGLRAGIDAIAARIAARDGNVDGARRYSVRAYETLRRGKWWRWRTGRAMILLTLAEAHLDLGETATAERLLREADASIAGAHRTVRLRARAALVQAAYTGLAGQRDDVRLSTAELGILPYLASHLTIPAIAAEVHRSPNTIKSQAASIYRKLGAVNRSEAVAAAYAAGLLREPEPGRDETGGRAEDPRAGSVGPR